MQNIKSLSDEQIVEIVRLKDKELFSEIINRYQEKLLRYANYLVFDQSKAADIVQESFIKTYINLNSFDVKKKFSSWIYRIVHNQAINQIHKDKNQKPISKFDQIKSDDNLEDEIIKKELIEHTSQCLTQLPFIYKEPLTLYYLENKSYDEICYILKIPIGTVGTRINRAKKILNIICLTKK